MAAWSPRAQRFGLELRVEKPDTPLVADTDGFRVRQLVDGLIANAVRVTPPGQPVVLAASTSGSDGVELQIRDGGPGLTDSDIEVAFERGALHSRYASSRPVGSGLGLAIVQRLARIIGAKLDVQGHGPEGGACFTVTIPNAQAGSAPGYPQSPDGLKR